MRRHASRFTSLFSPLSRLLDRLRGIPCSANAKPRRHLPGLEILEDRLCPAVDYWTGAGGNGNWTTAANWKGDVAPVAGDTLVFGTGARTQVANNNFAAGTVFNQIQIAADGYTLQGNAIQLQNGITNSFGLASVGFDITLGASQTFSDANGSSLILSGSINNNGHLWTVNPSGDILFNGKSISGSGGLLVEGDHYSGRFFLMDSAADTFTGTTTVGDAGVLFLGGARGNAIVGNLVVGDGPGPNQNDVVREAGNNQIANTSNVTVLQDGLLDLNGYTDTIGSLTMTGGYVTTGTGTLTLNGNVQTLANTNAAVIEGNLALTAGAKTFTVASDQSGDDLDIRAAISGGAGAEIIKAGAGTMNLTMDSTYAGSTLISAGTLIASSNDALGTSGVTVSSGATLDFADANLDCLSINGNLSNSGLVEFTGGSTGTMTVHGNYTQAAGASLDLAVAGTTAMDQMAITGKASLAGTLNVNMIDGFQPTGGNTFEIMTFASSNGSVGTLDLPHANVMTLAYDSHDLTMVDNAKPNSGGSAPITPPPGADVWTGAGGNSFWANPNNWASGVAPTAGQTLFFEIDPASTVSKNNYGAGTTFSSIVIAGSGYDITGNAVTLTNGLRGENTSGSNTVALALTLMGPESITLTNPGTSLSLTGSLNNGGSLLTVNTNGNVQFNGPSITGTGGLTLEGSGTLTLADTSPDVYTGATEVQPGATLILANSAALSSQTTVDNGGTLELLAGVMVSSADSLTLNGDGVNGAGALLQGNGNGAWNGNINLAANSAIGTGAGAVLTIGANPDSSELANGVITGAETSNLSYVGNGKVILAGPDTYAGYTTVVSGILALDNLDALTGAPISGGRGTAVQSGATLQLLAAGQYALDPLSLDGSGVAGQGALVSVTGNNTWIGPVKLEGNTTITSDAGSTFNDNVQMPNEGYLLTINAIGNVNLGNTISGAGGLTKDGQGTLTLSGPGPNLYTGPTTINAGTLVLSKNSAFEVVTGAGLTIEPGATVDGTGWINTSVTNSGVLSPGGTNNIGSLLIQGNYTQTGTGVLDMELASTSAMDQLNITGTAALGGTLNVSLLNGYQPAAGNSFEVMTFQSSTGKFATVNLPNPGNGVGLEAVTDSMELMIEALAKSLA